MPRPSDPYANELVVASGARTTSGDSGLLEDYGPAGSLRAQLHITAVSGTTPTLTVVVEDTLDGGTNWNQIGAFAANKNAAGNEVINISSPFGSQLRVRWTIGGTTPSFTFSCRIFSQIATS